MNPKEVAMILGTEQSISSATKSLLNAFENFQKIEAEKKRQGVLRRICDTPARMYRIWSLRKAKRALLLNLNSSFKCKDAEVFLEAGRVLQLIGLYERAKYCYNRAIEELRDCTHQDVRLLALMGILECTIEISAVELRLGKANPEGGERIAGIWTAAIVSDLWAASKEVREQIEKRLASVSHRLYQNSLKASVNGASWMFNNHRF